jgi:hypothetical protein
MPRIYARRPSVDGGRRWLRRGGRGRRRWRSSSAAPRQILVVGPAPTGGATVFPLFAARLCIVAMAIAPLAVSAGALLGSRRLLRRARG